MKQFSLNLAPTSSITHSLSKIRSTAFEAIKDLNDLVILVIVFAGR